MPAALTPAWLCAEQLGPAKPYQADAALGGNLSMLGGFNFIFPNFTEQVRTALTFNAGNIFQTDHVDGVNLSKL